MALPNFHIKKMRNILTSTSESNGNIPFTARLSKRVVVVGECYTYPMDSSTLNAYKNSLDVLRSRSENGPRSYTLSMNAYGSYQASPAFIRVDNQGQCGVETTSYTTITNILNTIRSTCAGQRDCAIIDTGQPNVIFILNRNRNTFPP